MPTDPLSTLALATGGAFLGKFVGPTAEHLGKAAFERAQQLGAKATALLAQVGREPQPVEPKLLLPLVQAASLETNETLAGHWAALLANAADPAQKAQMQPGFIEVLRQLTSLDALLFNSIAATSQSHATNANRVAAFYKVSHLEIDATDDEVAIALDNIVRLGLGTTRGPAPGIDFARRIGGSSVRIGEETPGRDRVAITYLGLAFLAACTPPTS